MVALVLEAPVTPLPLQHVLLFHADTDTPARVYLERALLIHTQPAHLQKLFNGELEVRERNEARARFLRRRLAERRGEQN